MRTRLVVLSLLGVALASAGCTGDGADRGSGAASHRPPVAVEPAPPPAPFRAATTRLPDGYTRAQCSDLRAAGANRGLAVRLVVPPGYHASDRDGTSCSFTAGFGTEFSVGFAPRTTLRTDKERNVDPFVDTGGDDSVSDVAYAGAVPVFGGHRGERLGYYCYCDGQDLDERAVQARGVRLDWTTRHGRQARSEPAYRAVTRSLALLHSRASTCSAHGDTVRFRPPIPQTESIDFPLARCHLYLRPGRGSLLRYAELWPDPTADLADRAATLRGRRKVTSVRLERGVTTLDGHRADRLTWVVTRTHQTQDYQPPGTWRIVTVGTPYLQATWGATPRQWRHEADDARAFFASAHLLGR